MGGVVGAGDFKLDRAGDRSSRCQASICCGFKAGEEPTESGLRHQNISRISPHLRPSLRAVHVRPQTQNSAGNGRLLDKNSHTICTENHTFLHCYEFVSSCNVYIVEYEIQKKKKKGQANPRYLPNSQPTNATRPAGRHSFPSYPQKYLLHFTSCGPILCTTLVPSINLVRKIRFALANMPSFKLTTIN